MYFRTIALSLLLASLGCRLPAEAPKKVAPTPKEAVKPAKPDPGGELLKKKVVPMVRKQIESGQKKIPCILLLKDQLIDSPDGFRKFCKANEGAKRLELRREVIAKLKAMAAEGQEAVINKLDNPKRARPLWIVNAVNIMLAPGEIKKFAALDEVKYVYGGYPWGFPSRKPARVSEVIKPAGREPFTTKGKRVPWNLEMIGARKVWEEFGITGEGAVVAMLDNGVNYRHPDLRNNIWINEKEIPNNGKDDDGNGFIDDYYGFNFPPLSPEVLPSQPKRPHGTWTSGIVAGDGSGGMVTGVAPRSKLMILMAWGFYNQAVAIQYALENGADVMNMSFSQPNLGQHRGFWRLMAEQATCAGLLMVSGAGNFGAGRQKAPKPIQIRIPEGIPCVLCAGGVNKDMKKYQLLSEGPVEWGTIKFYNDFPMPKGLVKPDVCGFSGPLFPVLGRQKGYIDPNLGIMGNSFSSPHIAGTAALILSAAPDTPAWKVKEIIETTAIDIKDKGKDNKTGWGLASAYRALCKATGKEIPPPEVPKPPAAVPVKPKSAPADPVDPADPKTGPGDKTGLEKPDDPFATPDEKPLPPEVAALADKPHAIKLDRPPAKGTRYRLSVEASSENSMDIKQRNVKGTSSSENIELEARVEVLETDDRGKVTRESYTIEKFDRIRFRKKNRNSLLDKGTVVVQVLKDGKDTFEIEGKPVAKKIVPALTQTVGLLSRRSGRDEKFGAADPRKVGDAWPVDPGIFVKDFETRGIKTKPQDIIGRTTVDRMALVKTNPCLQITGQVKITNYNSRLAPWTWIEKWSGTLTSRFTGRYPVDKTLGVVQEYREHIVKGTGSGQPHPMFGKVTMTLTQTTRAKVTRTFLK